MVTVPNGSSCSLTFLFSVPVRQDVIGSLQVADLATVLAAEMPMKDLQTNRDPVAVLTNRTKEVHVRGLFCGLPKILVQIPRPLSS